MQTKSQSPERLLLDIAARQHDVIAIRQLAAIGIDRGAVKHRVKIGRLHRLQRGVYAVGTPRVTKRGRWMGAVLAAGEGAVLSHRSAGALWGILRDDGRYPDVTVTSLGRRQREGIAIHAATRLEAGDRAVIDGIPVTSLARTLLDLAGVLSRDRFEGAFDEAERLRLLDVRALSAQADANPGRSGLRVVRELIDERRVVPEDTRSALEREFVRFCRARGFPMPAFNVLVEGFLVDAVWLQARVAIELDGYAFHDRTRRSFEDDRRRDTKLQAARFKLARVTHGRLHREPDDLEADLRALLRRSGPGVPVAA